MQILGAKVVGGLWAVECVTYSRNKLTLRTKLRNLHLQSQFSIFDSFRDIGVHTYDFLKFVDDLWALKWVWQTFFGQSIGIYKNNTFHTDEQSCAARKYLESACLVPVLQLS